MKYILTILLVTSFAIGHSQVKDFSLTNVQDGKSVSLSQFNSSKGLAVIFTSNVCPYAVYYEGRITQLVAVYKEKGIQFILINSHGEAKESNEEMANKISTWGLNIPYLSDKDQNVKSAFGARKSPEVFLLRNNNGKFSVFYQGAIDNNPQVASDVKEQYLKQNIEALLNNQSPKVGSRPIGCIIKG
ncbi:MAG: redoxin family protein [Bacteroidota bacterium]